MGLVCRCCQLEHRWLTAVFIDVVWFTELAERLEAEALAAILNDYYGGLASASDAHHGTLAKIQGAPGHVGASSKF